ncbi:MULTISPECIES: hypothetical protein [unclassified Frondihabitans]|uniref:hypothetical protein n=1 Tax=unclassified Frondihabitans TaxID=2626248 RepID=UPI000FA9661C|nr:MULTISPECIES: hypothetical protein [unclassified Frondihabitans]RPE78981.1 hypothetical protein EDF37_1670 [Frondihabitans sp. PhB153]RPF09261.1 hypothetical protein EDF39_1672 [Frondihabitans sp. PhB161]
MRNRTLVRVGNGVMAFGVVVVTASAALFVSSIPAAATAVPVGSDSAKTVSWVEAQTALGQTDNTTEAGGNPDLDSFKDLSFTVSQTANLLDQAVTVTWKGGHETSQGEYANDYVQLMQCWGHEASGPSPEQCEWGAPSTALSSLLGVNTAKRDLVRGDDPAMDPVLRGDAADPDYLLDPPLENPNLKAYRVPFRSVDGTLAKSTGDLSKIYDASTTNEVTAARTAANGSGQVQFETQSSLDAPQLGCGADQKTATGTAPRACWLVIVPRGTHNLDGSPQTETASGRISGSPLSTTAWKNRVVVKLAFQPVSQACPIGNPEQRLVGSEPVLEALTSWQPALCRLGTTYGYSQIGDAESRRQIVSSITGASRLGVVDGPLDPATTTGTTIRYAPVAQSSIVVAFDIDYRLYPDAPAADRNGLQATDLTLNARLVAKLLTQSYPIDVPGLGKGDATLEANPASIIQDPEFVQLNPAFTKSTSANSPAGLMVALGSSDASSAVWSWLRADPDAKAFLSGSADPWGMKMNPSYSKLNLATDATLDSFPKTDLTIAKGGDPDETGYGTLDMRPYMNDMHEGAYRTLRADPNEKDSWNPFGQPKGYTSTGPQVPGHRFLLSITDSASAERYGLSTAKLVNANGEALAPTSDSVTAAVAAMKTTSVPGVVATDAVAKTPGAYPLTMLSYAAVNVCAASTAELSDYAKFIRYGVGAGQVSGDDRGQLPRGYVPLSATLTAQAVATAKAISTPATVTAECPKPATPPTAAPAAPTTSESSQPAATVDETPQGTADLGDSSAAVADESSTDTGGTAVAVAQDPDAAGPSGTTPDTLLGRGRLGLVGALGFGVPALIAGPLLARWGRRLALLGG